MQKIWIIVQKNLTGTEKQCVALAEALNIPYEIFHIDRKGLQAKVTPYLDWNIKSLFPNITEDKLPNIIIAAGRQAIAPSLWIKNKNPKEVFTVFLQDPRMYKDRFDLIIAPSHDLIKGANLINTHGALTSITPKSLKKAQADFPELKKFNTPRIAFLIGGNSKTHKLESAEINNIIATIRSLEISHNASFFITASRRTGVEQLKRLRQAIQGQHIYLWDGNGTNPYTGFLAWADYIFVTNDSVSMVSESASTGKLVYLIPLKGGSAKFNRFYDVMISGGYVRNFEGSLENWGTSALQEASRVAKLVKERYQQFVTK